MVFRLHRQRCFKAVQWRPHLRDLWHIQWRYRAWDRRAGWQRNSFCLLAHSRCTPWSGQSDPAFRDLHRSTNGRKICATWSCVDYIWFRPPLLGLPPECIRGISWTIQPPNTFSSLFRRGYFGRQKLACPSATSSTFHRHHGWYWRHYRAVARSTQYANRKAVCDC